jgi:hypothetical protein
MEHVSQKARQSVIQQIEALVNQIQILAQAGGIDPMAAQQQIAQVQMEMQKPEELEKLVTIEQVRILSEVIPQLLPAGNDPMSDPLVQIRMQELNIKQQDLQRKAMDDAGQIQLELSKMQQRATTDAARIESQEEIADDRNEVNRERIEVQRQNAIMRMQNAPQGR